MDQSTSIPTVSKELHCAFRGYMSSPIFALVAKDDVSFHVHKDILSHHSQPFKEATSGTWKESDERKILLPDWDATTVGQLVQFLYTGDYNYGNPSTSDETQKPVEPAEPVLQRSRSGALTPFPECVQDARLERASPPMTDSMWLELVDTAEFDFEETFLVHAKVYTLAQFQAVAALKALALDRLSRTLLNLHPMQPNPHLATNIVSLATYVYANTDSLTSSEEPLRRIVSQYVALNFAMWQAEPAAVQLMCTGGEFVKDVLAKVCRRLGGTVVDPGLSSAGRYITKLRVVKQDFAPTQYIHQFDSRTGKDISNHHTIWLVPDYTADASKAASHFYLSQTVGVTITSLTGTSCGSSCRINRSSAVNGRGPIADIVVLRGPDQFLDLRMFPGFNGILSHLAHIEGYGSFHILWRSLGAVPV